jgi:hypothetical protein
LAKECNTIDGTGNGDLKTLIRGDERFGQRRMTNTPRTSSSSLFTRAMMITNGKQSS